MQLHRTRLPLASRCANAPQGSRRRCSQGGGQAVRRGQRPPPYREACRRTTAGMPACDGPTVERPPPRHLLRCQFHGEAPPTHWARPMYVEAALLTTQNHQLVLAHPVPEELGQGIRDGYRRCDLFLLRHWPPSRLACCVVTVMSISILDGSESWTVQGAETV